MYLRCNAQTQHACLTPYQTLSGGAILDAEYGYALKQLYWI
jgi:hypothetical protein